MFVDIVGFTDYTDHNGDVAAGDLLTGVRGVIREVCSDLGVRVAKWLGDGAMIVSVESHTGIQATLELSERVSLVCQPLALRVGVAVGKALMFEGDDYIGRAVNLASRLCDIAEPGAVFAPADVTPDLPNGVIGIPRGEVNLKGFADPVPIIRLQRAQSTISLQRA